MNIEVPEVTADLTETGSVMGYVKVADSAPFYVGCEAYLISIDGLTSQRCLIVDLLDDGESIGLRFIDEDNAGRRLPRPNYGLSDCSDFTVGVGASRLSMPRQLAPVEPAFEKPLG